MTMHLARGFTTTNTKRRKQNKKPGWEKAQKEHEAYLMKMGAHPSQRKGNKFTNAYKRTESLIREGSGVPCSNLITNINVKKTENTYTGDFITGIATMHKSNLVPVNKNTKGSDYATMRRG